GAVRVGGRRLDEARRSAGAVALVGVLLVDDPLQLAGALLDGALDVVLRHVLGLGGVDGGAEAGIAGGVAAALLGGDGDLADHLGEGGAALLVRDGLLPLDLFPLAMAGHALEVRLDPSATPPLTFPAHADDALPRAPRRRGAR